MHVLTGPDHLSALATLSANAAPLASFCLGLRWGVGHSTGLVLVGGILIYVTVGSDSAEIEVPHKVSAAFEALVGVFMLILGAYGLRRAYAKRPKPVDTCGSLSEASADVELLHDEREIEESSSPTEVNVVEFSPPIYENVDQEVNGNVATGSELEEDEEKNLDVETRSQEFASPSQSLLSAAEEEERSRRRFCRAFVQRISTGTVALLVGIVHGMAGPGGVLGVIPAVQLHDWRLATVYLSSFCVTSTLTMGGFATLYGTISSKMGYNSHYEFLIECVSAGLSLVVGILWLTLMACGKLDTVFP